MRVVVLFLDNEGDPLYMPWFLKLPTAPTHSHWPLTHRSIIKNQGQLQSLNDEEFRREAIVKPTMAHL